MPTISHKDLIEEFIEKHPKFHYVPKEELITVCSSLFGFVKDCMVKEIPLIRIKHFGKFVIYPNTIRKNLYMLKDKLEKGYISSEVFETLTERRTKLLKILKHGV